MTQSVLSRVWFDCGFFFVSRVVGTEMERGGRGGFGGGFGGERGMSGAPRRGRGGPRGGRRVPDEKAVWVPVTNLGRLVKAKAIKSIEEIFLHSLPIKEHQVRN
eukprot:Gregarina_sp_Poly_1__3213@NODE_1914_length_3092_cov_309_326612_g1235_i0_p6_GENE_NODE_1914_length_3092_cov_309_326612_g1235_i0NODE_1914_length_3092_cov_309_326612_g1235_i0_p6_ORF_typecomplete_len104_score13_59FoP_duplication/PF13865_6/11_NODE_1914_length_3092_cov_309_326612_g1235_i08551166